MITSITISGIAYDVDDAARKYVMKRIGSLDRYLPRHARSSVSADVKLKQVNKDHGNKYEVEVNMNIPGKVITAKDSTINIFSAIDIAEAKLKVQLSDYKQANIAHLGKRRIMSRFKQGFAREL
ncbi:ribosome-associated translation inhibitor RaiA [Candidatus Saccharibacteria bacterium]|nr:ribosome-associated translation inhibitor RaiA [Candidatus Saccharibacteria bacterium]